MSNEPGKSNIPNTPPSRKARRKVLFVLTVDTEEEFDWNGGFPQHSCSVQNIQKIPKFQAFCESLNIRPTYLVDYPVATNQNSALTLRTIAATKKAEIGAHLHPWCTPPIEGENGEYESHVINLPPDLVRKKLKTLTAAIEDNIHVRPSVFRTGRWGTNASVLAITMNEGYKVDSSIYPYYTNEYFSCDHAIGTPYWPSIENPKKAGAQKSIFEIPVTAGFNRPNFPFWAKIHRLMSSKFASPLRLVGFAWKTKALRKLYLSPELSSTSDMITLTDAALASEHPVIHMFIHSSSLLPGRNEFTQNREDEKKFYTRIESVVKHLAAQSDVTFCTLSEAQALLHQSCADHPSPR